MKILVINGSPAGKNSITLQTVLYIEQFFPQHSFEILHAAAMIRAYEKDFSKAAKAMEEADLILFCYPVYTFLAPAQLHRFIELMQESGADLSAKYASQITTSKHFYDITAHRFIEDRCSDLSLKYIRGLSADMEDLLSEKGQDDALSWFRFLLFRMKEGLTEPAYSVPARKQYEKASPAPETKKTKPWKAAIVCDLSDDADGALAAMIERFRNVLPLTSVILRLDEFPIAGGCLGCFHCAADGTCIYKDGFDAWLRSSVQSCDAIVYAFSIKDHSMGTRFKLYDDRQFCNGHRTVTMGKPNAYLIHGDLSAEENLRTLIKARAEVGGNYLAAAADDTEDTDRKIDQAASLLTYALDHKTSMPADFYGVGGMKIFRDLIWQMQGLMKEDHRFYKEHGFYNDFPQKHKMKTAAMYLVGAMMTNEKLSKKLGGKMTEGMIMPYQKVIENAGKKRRKK